MSKLDLGFKAPKSQTREIQRLHDKEMKATKAKFRKDWDFDLSKDQVVKNPKKWKYSSAH